ncbi:MAG: xanthine dehydrogenase family protein molybdopterin-binding subunit [Alphaproteobacteria bacterium]|nr:xanthine dehydrogenase family protein molybdopterin-binding subunit [Alphaproteobacteria bacterium]
MNAPGAPIGLSLPRLEAGEKAIGTALYTGDMVLPGMLHGAIVQSPHAHARILGYDTSKALAVPGVRAVITGDDIEFRYMGLVVKDETAIAKGKVRYIGEPVAAVAAIDAETARRAAQLIEIRYQPLPAVTTIEEALHDGAPMLHEDFAKYAKIYDAPVGRGNLLAHSIATQGDPAKGFAMADVVVEETYTIAAQYHAYMEPCAALAAFDPSGKVTVWSSTQSIFRTQANLHECLGLPMTKIRCIAPRVGGGFGGKSEATVEPIAVLLAKKGRAPVRLVLSRNQDMTAMRTRHPGWIRLKTGATKDGRLVARDCELWFDGGAYADDSPAVMNFALYFVRGPYEIPNVHCEGYAVYTNRMRAGAFRGFGNPQMTFATESQMDALAAKLRLDPIELRIKNALPNGARWFGGQAVTESTLVEALETARTRAGWDKPMPPAPPGKRRGRGVAAMAHSSAFLSTGAIVRLQNDGTIAVQVGAVDIGQGSDTALSQMAASAFQLPVEQINLATPDTDSAPYNSGTNASRVTFMVGKAVGEAAFKARDQIIEHAAAMLGVKRDEVSLAPGGRVVVTGGSRHNAEVSFADVAARSIWAVGGPVIGSSAVMASHAMDQGHTKMSGWLSFEAVGIYTFGAQIVEVEIDEVTGAVEVTRAVCVHDVGRAINPCATVGQIEGGFAQGMGYGLCEEMVFEDGRLANPSFMDYKIPSALEVPKTIECVLIEKPEASHPFGARGIGEPPLVGAAAAIANAVADAIGKPLTRLPLTPERVLRALLAQ